MDITFSNPDSFKVVTKQLSIGLGQHVKSKVDLRLLNQESPSSHDEEVVFGGPGEYEVKGCMVTGVSSEGKDATINTAYQVTVDDLRLGYLGDLAKPLTDQQLEQLGAIDVLIISLENMKIDEIAKQISTIEPSIVIPMSFDEKSLAELAKDMGAKVEPVEKLKVTKKELPQDITLTVLQ